MLNNTELLLSAIQDDQCAEVVLELLEGGVDWTIKDSEDSSMLVCAALYNTNPEVISVLIKAGADIEERDEDGWTPLMHAASSNTNPEVISVLIEAGADLEATSTNGRTPLMAAASSNTNPEVISVLIESGADPEEGGDSVFASSFEIAVRSNTNPGVISALARATDPLYHDPHVAGDRLVECASDINGNRKLIDALMEAGAEVSLEELELFRGDQELHKVLSDRLNNFSFKVIGDTIYYDDGTTSPAPPEHLALINRLKDEA